MTVRAPWPRLLLPAGFAVAFAVLAWIVLARHGSPYGIDTGPHHWSVAHRPHAAATGARVITDLGTGVFPPIVAALGGWLAGAAAVGGPDGRTYGTDRGRTDDAAAGSGGGARTRFRRGVPLALLAVIVLLVGQSVRTGLMTVLHRSRPPAADWAAHASGHAFPSGHTSSSAIAAGLLTWGLLRFLPGRRGRVPAGAWWLVALAVGCTRVYLGVHWPTDVLGGWLFAGFWLSATLPFMAYVAARRESGRRPAAGNAPAPVRPSADEARPEGTGRPGRTAQPERTEQPRRTDRPERSDQTDTP